MFPPPQFENVLTEARRIRWEAHKYGFYIFASSICSGIPQPNFVKSDGETIFSRYKNGKKNVEQTGNGYKIVVKNWKIYQQVIFNPHLSTDSEPPLLFPYIDVNDGVLLYTS